MPLTTSISAARSARGRLRSWLSAALLTLVAVLATATPAHAFALGFNDEDLVHYAGGGGYQVNENWLAAGLNGARGANANTWRFMVRWRDVAALATTAPVPADLAADPAWSGYRWDYVDRMVRGITAAGMTPLLWVAKAPDWAEGAGAPAKADRKFVPAGTWRPNAGMLQRFATALAKRYSGTFPDPARPGQLLPRVSNFQAWNEPNLYTEVNPQWVKTRGKYKVASVSIYRALLNRFYRGIKQVQPTATVLAAGSAPFGGLYPGDTRIQPAAFYRELFCETTVKGKLKARKGCVKANFDGWAHHTYPIGPPTRTARNKDDVVVPDMPKLTKIMAAAVKAGLVKKAAAANLWVTEMSWESAPDPNGLSLADHALYMQGAYYVLWKAGVKNILWWNSRDDAQGRDWNLTYQSGIFARGANPTLDTPKPAFTAFRFPFAAYRVKGVANLWTKFPGSGAVTVQAQNSAGAWSNVATLAIGTDGTATGRIRVGPATNLRAVQGTETSLTWRTF